MGTLMPLDSDVVLILSVAALIYSEGGDKRLLMGLMILILLINGG